MSMVSYCKAHYPVFMAAQINGDMSLPGRPAEPNTILASGGSHAEIALQSLLIHKCSPWLMTMYQLKQRQVN